MQNEVKAKVFFQLTGPEICGRNFKSKISECMLQIKFMSSEVNAREHILMIHQHLFR